MQRAVVTALCTAAICLSTGCRNQSTAPPSGGQNMQAAVPASGNPTGSGVDPVDVAFGYTNSAGSKLLMLVGNEPIDLVSARAMTAAVCSDSREFQIRYAQFQARTAADNGRQSDGNFANDEGHLFDIVQGQAARNDTCLLVPAGYLQAFPISRNELTKSERDTRGADRAPVQVLTELAKQGVSRIEKEKGRAVRTYWPLHRSASQEVAAVEFAELGDSLLGSLVLVEPVVLLFYDMPASLAQGRKDGGCWRVDDECRFQYDGMEVRAVLGAPGHQLLFFTFAGAEGQLIQLLETKDGKLVELRRAYRYQSPL